jgi:hypothetical protein
VEARVLLQRLEEIVDESRNEEMDVDVDEREGSEGRQGSEERRGSAPERKSPEPERSRKRAKLSHKSEDR